MIPVFVTTFRDPRRIQLWPALTAPVILRKVFGFLSISETQDFSTKFVGTTYSIIHSWPRLSELPLTGHEHGLITFKIEFSADCITLV